MTNQKETIIVSDDFKANTRTTGSVAVGGSATGDIEKAKDVDWFAVELVAGRTYVIDLEGADTGGGTLGDAMLRGLYDSAGGRVAGRDRDGGEGGNARLTFTATESGTHYIAARSQDAGTGTYTVRVTAADPVPVADPDATAAGATDLGDLTGLDGMRTHRGAVDGEADGADYYRFTLSEAKAVRLTLRDQDANADLYLEDGDGNVLHSSAKEGTRTEKIDETLAAGTYYVRVAAGEEGDNDYGLRYRVSAPEPQSEPEPQPEPEAQPQLAAQPEPQQTAQQQQATPPVDPDATVAGATDLGDLAELGRRGSSHEGSVERGTDGTDYFRFTLGGHKTVKFKLDGLDANADLYLEDDQGNVLASSTKGGTRTEQITATLLKTAAYPWSESYYLRVEARQAGENDYTLSYSTSGWLDVGALQRLGEHFNARPQTPFGEKPDHSPTPPPLTIGATVPEPAGTDFAQDSSTAGRVLVGESATGKIGWYGDVDWYAVNLEKDTVYRIDLKGAPTGDGTLRDPLLAGIYDGKGQQVGRADDDSGMGGNSLLFFTPDETGTYYVAAQNVVSGDGTYTLSVTEPADDFAADASTTGKVAVGSSAAGKAEHPDDVDWFAVTLEAGKTYRVDLHGEPNNDSGVTFQERLHGIWDTDGNRLHDGDSGGASGGVSRAFLTPGEDGTYYVAAGSASTQAQGGHGDYTLSVEEVTDDYAADTGTAGAVTVGGSIRGDAETPGDQDWFAVTLEKGKGYAIKLDGSWDGGTLWDFHLWGALYDEDGKLIEEPWDDGDPAGCGGAGHPNTLNYWAPETGTYYVEARSSEEHVSATGIYLLSVEEL